MTAVRRLNNRSFTPRRLLKPQLDRFVVGVSRGETCLSWVGEPDACLRFLIAFNLRIDELIHSHGTDEVAESIWTMYMGSHVLNSAFDTTAMVDVGAIFASMKTLYHDGFAKHCPDRRHFFNELAGAAYMLWDMSCLEYHSFRDDKAYDIPLGDLVDFGLGHDHAVVQESILHGLGHRQDDRPGFVDHRIAAFLSRNDISDDIRRYAEQCATGMIQ